MKLYSATIGLAAVVFFACGGQPKAVSKAPNKPQATEEAPAPAPAPEPATTGRSVLLGWFCPTGAAGRPAVRPLFARDPSWASELPALNKAIASRRVRRFTVMAWQGHAAGSMIVMGSAQDAKGKLAMGSYVGASACQPRSTTGLTDEDPVCQSITAGCALALGELEPASGFNARPYDEDPARLDLLQSKGCEAGDFLLLDTDGDGKAEHFSTADLRGDGAAPAELPLADGSTATCEPNYAAAVIAHTDLVRMAVLDVDGDGRAEVLYRRNSNELLLYGAPSSPARLELLGQQKLTPGVP